jgi:hypothetical protein
MLTLGLRSRLPKVVAFDIHGCDGREDTIVQALRASGLAAEVHDGEPGQPPYVTVRLRTGNLHQHGLLLGSPTTSGGTYYNLSAVENLVTQKVEEALRPTGPTKQPV